MDFILDDCTDKELEESEIFSGQWPTDPLIWTGLDGWLENWEGGRR